MNSASADAPAPLRERRGIVTGIAAGAIALGCCVGPAVLALIGITSATVAIDVATDLYGTWGWAFKLAGIAFAGATVALSVRRRRACGAKPRVWRSVGIVLATGAITYSALYGATTWLGARASDPLVPPTIRVEGSSIGQRVQSAIDQVRRHYPHFRVDLQGLSSEGVAFIVGWDNPTSPALDDEYRTEMTRRVEDSREATFVLLQSIARSNPSMRRFSAYEDQFFIPIWSRPQLLRADPSGLREFDAYSRFVFSAENRAGYAVLFGDQSR